jgi:ribosomal protein L37E
MPYVTCSRCGLTNFTAAYWSSTEQCSSCGTPLPRPRRGSDPRTARPLFGGGRVKSTSLAHNRALAAAIVREHRLRQL